MQADKFVVQDIKQPVIEKSIIKPDKQNDIENIINEKPFKLGQQTMVSDQTNDLDILLINPVKDFKPALTKGHYPQSNNEIAVNKN